ncbi:metallophosphoesterase [Brevibacillus centrosporus]|uniref:metallophosphoesterase n=1 Tax=Brevibacillus centrosporus TaxID=54910 RepID=UPI0037FDEBF0
MSRILAISDIHGHVEGVKLLLQKAGYQPQTDKLFFVGDYIDKDPSTWKSLDYIRERVQQGAKAIIGNLEMWYLETIHEKGSSYRQEIGEWLQTLPTYLTDEDYLFVHAGMRPHIPISEQTREDLLTIRKDFWGAEQTLPQKIIFGHTPTHMMGAKEGEIWCQPGRIGIDTGAKHHIRLTLVDLTNRCAYSCSTEKQRLYQDTRLSSW